MGKRMWSWWRRTGQCLILYCMHETINSNACGISLFQVWEQDFCTASMVLTVLYVTIVGMKIHETSN